MMLANLVYPCPFCGRLMNASAENDEDSVTIHGEHCCCESYANGEGCHCRDSGVPA